MIEKQEQKSEVSSFSLSERLKAIGAMVDRGSRLADIGTDHGYLPIWLAEAGIVPAAIAMDVKEGPLSRARIHVKEHGLEEKIELRLSDGFSALSPGEADTAVIAGMGGLLMVRILEQGEAVARSLRQLILSPQSEIGQVRRFLLEKGYEILAEDMVFDEGKYYTIIKAAYGGQEKPVPEEDWSYIELRYGRFLLASGKPVVTDFLRKEIRTLEEVEKRLSEAATPRAGERLPEVEEELQAAREALCTAEEQEGKGTCEG